MRIDDNTIRNYLDEKHNVGNEALDMRIVGDGWFVRAIMPNTDIYGWFFAGHCNDIIAEIKRERIEL